MNIASNDKSYDFLINIGFTLNEAKVYLALVKFRLLNGYEVAKESGVSRSLVYDVLNRLVTKGFVNKILGETTLYSVLEFDKVLDIISKNTYRNIVEAKERIKKIGLECPTLLYISKRIFRENIRCFLTFGAFCRIYN